MLHVINRARQLLAVAAVTGIAAGCAVPHKESSAASPTTSVSNALTTFNGLTENGLTTNGLWVNGLWVNGLWVNGLWVNGLWVNGLWVNGLWVNGLWVNGLWVNGQTTNGLWVNGLWVNGLWSEKTWTTDLTGPAAIPGDTLRSSPYARQLLHYIYECAMPGPTLDSDGAVLTSYDTSLDPNTDSSGNGGLPCSAPDAGGSNDSGTGSAGGTCGLGYTCVQEKCVVPLNGAIGLAVNDDGTTWWGQPAPGGATNTSVGKWGQCDESCQRWISACVLARTNAYGEHVEISMSVPDSPPANPTLGQQLQFAAVKHALRVGANERLPCQQGDEADPNCGYTNREGAYYGNIFATTPVDATGQPTPPPLPVSPATTYSGPANGALASSPQFYACAGPDSNTPEITKRFCSSQGDQSVINVPGVCVTTANETGVCTGMDASGSIFHCSTEGSNPALPAIYDQVITVYLKQPMSVCPNNVCEEGEADPSSPSYCPSDCHPATWANTFGVDLLDDSSGGSLLTALPRKVALNPLDNSVVVADVVCDAPALDLDPHDNPAHPIHSLTGSTGADLVLASYDTTGNYLWGLRDHLAIFGSITGCGAGTPGSLPGVGVYGVSAGADGSIAVAGYALESSNFLWVAKFAPGGAPPTLASGWPIQTGGGDLIEVLNLAMDQAGNVAVTGPLNRAATFGTISVPATAGKSFVAKLWSDGSNHSGGPAAWAVGEPPSQVTGIAFDSNGDVVTTMTDSTDADLYVLSGAGGAGGGAAVGSVNYFALPSGDLSRGTRPEAVVADSNGGIYVAGFSCLSGEVECNSRLIKYTTSPTNPAPTWLWTVNPSSSASATSQSFGEYLALDGAGHVLVSGPADNVDFGAGLFQTFAYSNAFVAAYATTDPLPAGQQRFSWAKQVPFVLDNVVTGFAADAQGHVVLAGDYSGSMQLDDVLLVNTVPEVTNHPNAFVGSFLAPPSDDTTAPLEGPAKDQTGASINTVPQDIFLPATVPATPPRRAGTYVFFMPPTASDKGNAGTNVVCTPAPNTFFQLGTTQVKCVASDPAGNASPPSTFNVTVVDEAAPVFLPAVSSALQLTNALSVTVSETEGAGRPIPVTCSPTTVGPGSAGPTGELTTSCAASDGSSVQLTVNDTLGSVLSPVADISVVSSGLGDVSITYPKPLANDQLEGSRPVSCTPDVGNAFPLGKTQVTCTTADSSQNQAQVTFSVTVLPPPINVSCVGAPGAPVALSMPSGVCGVTIDGGGLAGTCSGGTGNQATCTFDGASSETLGPGVHTVAVVGMVGSAAASCTSYVQVTDEQKPTATCASQTAECTGNGGATVTPSASCMDNCSCTTSCTTAFFPMGVSSGSCTATDPTTNSTTCQAAITVVDSAPPVVTPRSGPSQLQCNIDNWTDPGAVALDVCVGDLSAEVQATGAIDPTHVGSYTESYSATDPSGHTGSATRAVTVIDTLAPVLTLNASPSALQCGVDKYLEAGAKATDVCAGDLTSKITETGAVVSTTPGAYTVAYSVSDPSRNTTQASRTVTVVDTLAPTTSATIGPSTTPNHSININVTSYTVTPKGGGTTISGSASCWTAPGIAVTLNAADACALKQIVYALSGAQNRRSDGDERKYHLNREQSGKHDRIVLRDGQGGKPGRPADGPHFRRPASARLRLLLRAGGLAQEPSGPRDGHGQGNRHDHSREADDHPAL